MLKKVGDKFSMDNQIGKNILKIHIDYEEWAMLYPENQY